MTEGRRLVREPSVGRGRVGRLERRPRDDEDADRGARAAGERCDRDDRGRDEGRGRGRRGRPALNDEVRDLGRGGAFMGVESAAVTLDLLARVLRRAVDRAFDEDYDRPGDVVRGVTRELDDVGYDMVSELRGVPRKLSRRFDESLRSPRADTGERERRADDDSTTADSPAANGERRRIQRVGRE